MPFTITLQHNNEIFTVNSDESILQAGIRQGITLPHGCGNGACGTCICKIITGSIEYRDTGALAFFENENTDTTLCCVAFPSSDLTIKLKYPDTDFEPWV